MAEGDDLILNFSILHQWNTVLAKAVAVLEARIMDTARAGDITSQEIVTYLLTVYSKGQNLDKTLADALLIYILHDQLG